MKLDSASVGAIILASVGFIFSLTCLDWMLMSNFMFWKDPDLLYRYWTILALIIIAFSFMPALWAYVMKLRFQAVLVSFFTPILLFVAGLLDQFFQLLAFVQGNQPYSWDVWSAQYKWFGFWNASLQLIWSAVFYGLLAYLWYRVLKK
jgi:hypothetical protein